MNYHDPLRQVSYLQQCLAHDKKPIGILLGAGAPMGIRMPSIISKPLIPDIKTLTRQICDQLSGDKSHIETFNQIYSYFQAIGNVTPTIEDILSYIRALCQIVGCGQVNGLTLQVLKSFDNTICTMIDDIVKKELSDNDTPYHEIAAWIGAIPRAHPVEVFTTNYDLLMEQALEDLHVPYFDGFSGSRHTFFDITTIEDDRLPERWARLWKLHGSINWFMDKNMHLYRSFVPHDNDDSIIIHPSHLKYEESRKMPYLAMTDRLRAFFKKPSALLLICGYSFGDMHINDMIIQGLQSNPNSIAFGMLYDSMARYQDAVSLAKRCPNLSLLAKDSAVIGMQHLNWTEKDANEGNIKNSYAVEWHKDLSGKRAIASFVLGNFENMGYFIGDIIGVSKGESI